MIDGWSTELMNVAVFLLLARLLGPADFGIVALTAAFTAIATGLIVYAVMQVLIQRSELEPGHCDAVFILTLGGSASAAILLSIGSPALARLFQEPLMASLLPWLSLTMPLQALGVVPLGLLTRRLQFGATARRTLLMITCGGIVGIVLAYRGFGPWALVAQHLVSNAVGAIVLLVSTEWRPGLRARSQHYRDIRLFVAASVGNQLFLVIRERMPVLVIGYVLGPAATGVFSLANRLVDVLTRVFVVPINQIAVPGIAAVHDAPARVRQLVQGLLALGSFLAAPAFVGAAALAPHALVPAFGEDWAPAVGVFQLLALRGIVWPQLLLGQSVLYGLGRPERLLAVNRMDLVADVALLVLAAQIGLSAIAAVTVLRLALWRLPLLAHEVRELSGLGMGDQVRPLVLASVAAALMGAVVVAIMSAPGEPGVWRYAVAMAAGVAVYLAMSAVLNRDAFGQLWAFLATMRDRWRQAPA